MGATADRGWLRRFRGDSQLPSGSRAVKGTRMKPGDSKWSDERQGQTDVQDEPNRRTGQSFGRTDSGKFACKLCAKKVEKAPKRKKIRLERKCD